MSWLVGGGDAREELGLLDMPVRLRSRKKLAGSWRVMEPAQPGRPERARLGGGEAAAPVETAPVAIEPVVEMPYHEKLASQLGLKPASV